MTDRWCSPDRRNAGWFTVLTCALTIAGALTVTVAAAPAHSDPDDSSSAAVDQSFLAALKAADIEYSDPGKAVKAGQTMCALVDSGKSGKTLIATLQKHNESLTTERAGQFVSIALQTYCPQNFRVGMNGPAPKR